MFRKTFVSYSVGCVFTQFTLYFSVQKLFNPMIYHCWFYFLRNKVYLENPCLCLKLEMFLYFITYHFPSVRSYLRYLIVIALIFIQSKMLGTWINSTKKVKKKSYNKNFTILRKEIKGESRRKTFCFEVFSIYLLISKSGFLRIFLSLL